MEDDHDRRRRGRPRELRGPACIYGGDESHHVLHPALAPQPMAREQVTISCGEAHSMTVCLLPKQLISITRPEGVVMPRLKAVFEAPTETTCYLNYAEGARCGRLKRHEGPCSQVSRWVPLYE